MTDECYSVFIVHFSRSGSYYSFSLIHAALLADLSAFALVSKYKKSVNIRTHVARIQGQYKEHLSQFIVAEVIATIVVH